MANKTFTVTSSLVIISFLSIVLTILPNSILGISDNNYNVKYENPFVETWRWHTYPELIGKGCRSMAEEANGNLWFGVSGGVIRYDGFSWDFFQIDQNSKNIPVVSLFVASNGIIYAGTTNGISIFENGIWKKMDFNLNFGDPVEYPYNKIPIVEGKDKSIWMGAKQGAIRIRDGRTTLYRVETIFTDIDYENDRIKKLKLFDVYSILEDEFGHFWFGLRNGEIYKCVLKDTSMNSIPKWSRIDEERNYIKIKYPLIERDNKGRTYIASSENDGGINIHNGKQWRRTKFKEKYQIDDIYNDITKLADGKICVAGIGRIFIGDINGWEMYDSPTLPFASNRLILFQAADQNLWILGLNNEVWKVDLSTRNWATYLGLIFQTEDKDNNYWFISFDGKIVSYNLISQKWKEFDHKDGVIETPIKIISTKEGTVWVAGSHKQIASTAFLKGSKWIKQSHPELGWAIDRRAVFEADDGSLWFGSCSDIMSDKGQKGGLVRYSNITRTNNFDIDYEYHHPDKNFGLTAIYGLGQTEGVLWAGQLGFYSYNTTDKNWRRISEPKGLKESFIDCMDTTPNGDLWVGTRTEGVFYRNSIDSTWRQFTAENGLSSNTIITIFAENDNNIWVATDKDISHYDGSSWTQKVFLGNFNTLRDGISIHRTSDGSLWINQNPPIWYRKALYNNQISYDLAHDFKVIKHFPDKIAPETNITIFQDRISQPGNVILSWVGNDPWKSTFGPHLKYSYRMDNNEWSEFTNKTNDIFLELSKGEHTFQVRSRDLDFNIDETPATVSFYVIPPVWLQTWFIALILSFLLTITFFIIYLYHRNKIIKEISETKVKLFANISHELRTPLTLILGPLTKVLESPLLSQELKGSLSRVNRNTHRLLRLVNQVLDFRKMEFGQLKFKARKGDIIALLKEEVLVFEEAVKSKNIDLVFEPFTEHLILWFDPDKIEKIMFNILSNGLKFTQPNGKITVKVSSAILKKSKTITIKNNKSVKFDNWLQIEVTDTGVGISKRNLDKIFNRFYQAQENGKTSVGGTGIGLSVAKEMAEIHFGKLIVESQEGKGTTFTILIPLIEEDMLQSENEDNKVQSSEFISLKYPDKEDDEEMLNTAQKDRLKKDKNKILVVEDNFDMREYIKEELIEDFVILEACNGNQGFEEAVKENPDLIISDIMMPQVDGIEFCKKIKSDERTSHIAVILLTAKSSKESKIEGLETGADDYLTKPFFSDELRIRIDNIISSRRKFAEKFGKSLHLEPSNIQITSVDQKFIKKAISIVEENIDDNDFGVEKFSMLIGMSRVGLYNKLKILTNHSVQEFIFLIKLKRAAQLLKESGMSVTEISYEVGFKDPSHFSRLFKKQYGQPPRTYMNEHKKLNEEN